jgi:hypothetical protein
VQNYFNYFTEIEEHFQRRRGSLLLLSTLDWALIETWREAGIPLAAVLRGIDDAFDRYEARQLRAPGKRLRSVNGLAWTAQAVLEAAEAQKEAAIGVAIAEQSPEASVETGPDLGFEADRISAHLETAALALETAAISPEALQPIAKRLRELAETAALRTRDLEELERWLMALEDKLFAVLTTYASDDLLVGFKAEAARSLATYRSRMTAVQLRQIEQQFVHKRLLEHYKLPRLSLFYMSQS